MTDDPNGTPAEAARKRSPTYHVFERQTLARVEAVVEEGASTGHVRVKDEVSAWVLIASVVAGATDRKAIASVIGTHENPVEGFDAERRLLPHVAVLTCHWRVRERTRTVNEPTPEERAELEARLAGTVTEEWV